MKSKIKKILTATASASLGLVTLGASACKNVEVPTDNADRQQINYIINELGGDPFILSTTKKDEYKLLAHNDNQPICVTISDDCSPTMKATIEDSLDYMFGVISDINPNYQYDLVDSKTANESKSEGKTVIEYSPNEKECVKYGANAICKRVDTELAKKTNDQFCNLVEIKYNPTTMDNSEVKQSERHYIMLHELCHAFGLDDIYFFSDRTSTNTRYDNSLMAMPVGFNFNSLLPNDYKCLVALYSPRFENESQKNEFVDNFSDKCTRQEKSFYKKFVAGCVDKNSSLADLEEIYSTDQLKGEILNSGGQTSNLSYTVSISDDKYSLTLVDQDKNKIAQIKGDSINLNGVAVLKNVEFDTQTLSKLYNSNVLTFDKIVSDIAVFNTGEDLIMHTPNSLTNPYLTAENLNYQNNLEL